MSFQLTIVSPEAVAFDEEVVHVILPATDGLVGVLTGRSPLMASLKVGPLIVDTSAGRRHFLIDGGVAQMKDNKLTVLATSAIPASALNAETARNQYAELLSQSPTDDKSIAERNRRLKHAVAAQALAGKE